MFIFLLFVAIVVLFALLQDTRGRLKRAEATLEEAAKRIGALQRAAGLLPPKPGESFAPPPPPPPVPTAEPPPMPAPTAASAAPQPPKMTEAEMRARWGRRDEAGDPPDTAPASTTDSAGEPGAEADGATSEDTLRVAAFTAPRAPEVVADLTDEVEAPTPGADASDGASPSEPMPAPAQLAMADRAPEMAVVAPPPERPLPHEPASPPAPPAPPPGMAARFENLFGKTLPIWAGGITLAIAGVLIVRYAIDAGFFARIFTRGVQVIAGGIFGLSLIGGAELAWRNEHRVRDTRVPQALSGAGIATLYAAVLVAANVYLLIGPALAFALLAAITAAALGLSLRFGAPSALLGLAGGLAAPALVGSVEPNVPLLAVYLGLTITGLTGVARMRRWPWLAIAALAGGAGWSLWMVAAGNALDLLGTLSVGSFILLLAIALPLLSLDGPRSWMLRTASAVIGALQLALLVALGGFAPLEWGLFALLALAGQWLAWRDANFTIVPTISLALSALLLLIWPDPAILWFAIIALSLAAIHAVPLLARLDSVPRALELGGLALAAPLLVRWQFPDVTDGVLAPVALGAALVSGAGVARLWRAQNRSGDARLAWLASIAAALVALTLGVAGPAWAAPLAIGASAAALLVFGQIAADRRIEPVVTGFVAAAMLSLLAAPLALAEITSLLLGHKGPVVCESLARLGGWTALFAFFAVRAEAGWRRLLAVALAGGFAYAALAQLVPGWSLPLAMSGVALAIFLIGQQRAVPMVERLAAGFAAAALALLALTGPQAASEWLQLIASDRPVAWTAPVRWGSVTAMWAILAWRAASERLRWAAHIVAGAVAYGLLAQLVPGWSLPLALALVALGMDWAARRGQTQGVSAVAVLFAISCVPLLIISADNATAEWSRLWGSDAAVAILSLLRWTGVAALALYHAVRARHDLVQRGAQIAAALLSYGALAQIVPAGWLMLVPAISSAALLLCAPKIPLGRAAYACAALGVVAVAWALPPLAVWAAKALASLGGVPMLLDDPALSVREVSLRLLIPALLVGGSVCLRRRLLPPLVARTALAAAALVGGVALHALYRHGFAALIGSDFISFGLGQRLLWAALLIGSGMLAARRHLDMIARSLLWAGTLHLVWYSLLLHNPLWTPQAVGGMPLLNLIAPLFLLAWFGTRESVARLPQAMPGVERGREIITMMLVGGFAWASLRHAFHGTLLVEPGTSSTENILRSILILGLAIGFLLWGINRRRHDWRIASLVLMLAAVAKVFLFDASGLEGLLRIGSFVALGFSLIGIGWLYSRQLQRDTSTPPLAEA